MANGIYSALSGALANEVRVELLSHNLANVNTAGFAGFQVALEEAQGNVVNEELSFAAPTEITHNISPGPIVSTDNNLDLSFSEGVFMAVSENGMDGFVRSASLLPTPDGRLKTTMGHDVKWREEPLPIPADVRNVEVNVQGQVFADGEIIGQLDLIRVNNPGALVFQGNRLVVNQGDAGIVPIENEQVVLPGYLEMSNVSAVESMTNLISAHRNYSVSLNVIDNFSRIERRIAAGFMS